MDRRWIGIDITHLAIALIKHRLQGAYGDRAEYGVYSDPNSLSGASALANEDRYQFQWWAIGLVGARPIEQKKGADQGIDGRLYFHDEGPRGRTKQIILQVKSGHVGAQTVRDLRGVVEREGAPIGVLVTLHQPTQAMYTEAAVAGFYESYIGDWDETRTGYGRYPRLQILTVEQLLNGARIDHPPSGQVNRTFKRVREAERDAPDTQQKLPFRS